MRTISGSRAVAVHLGAHTKGTEQFVRVPPNTSSWSFDEDYQVCTDEINDLRKQAERLPDVETDRDAFEAAGAILHDALTAIIEAGDATSAQLAHEALAKAQTETGWC